MGLFPRRSLYVCALTGEVCETPPHLCRYAELARLLIYAVVRPEEAANAESWAQQESKAALAEGRRMLSNWSLHKDQTSGREFWHCQLSGRSSWENPAAPAMYFSNVCEHLFDMRKSLAAQSTASSSDSCPSAATSSTGQQPQACRIGTTSSEADACSICSTNTGDSDVEEVATESPTAASSALPDTPSSTLPLTPNGLPATPSSVGIITPLAGDAVGFFTAREEQSPRPWPSPASAAQPATPSSSTAAALLLPPAFGPLDAASALVGTASALAAVASALAGAGGSAALAADAAAGGAGASAGRGEITPRTATCQAAAELASAAAAVHSALQRWPGGQEGEQTAKVLSVCSAAAALAPSSATATPHTTPGVAGVAAEAPMSHSAATGLPCGAGSASGAKGGGTFRERLAVPPLQLPTPSPTGPEGGFLLAAEAHQCGPSPTSLPAKARSPKVGGA